MSIIPIDIGLWLYLSQGESEDTVYIDLQSIIAICIVNLANVLTVSVYFDNTMWQSSTI